MENAHKTGNAKFTLTFEQYDGKIFNVLSGPLDFICILANIMWPVYWILAK